jgi:hypothetical protein
MFILSLILQHIKAAGVCADSNGGVVGGMYASIATAAAAAAAATVHRLCCSCCLGFLASRLGRLRRRIMVLDPNRAVRQNLLHCLDDQDVVCVPPVSPSFQTVVFLD